MQRKWNWTKKLDCIECENSCVNFDEGWKPKPITFFGMAVSLVRVLQKMVLWPNDDQPETCCWGRCQWQKKVRLLLFLLLLLQIRTAYFDGICRLIKHSSEMQHNLRRSRWGNDISPTYRFVFEILRFIFPEFQLDICRRSIVKCE